MGKADDFRLQIESELGFPVIKIETVECSWEAIIARAKRWFRAKKGVLDCVTVPIVQDKFDYDFPANACAIIDVILPRRSDIQSLLSLGFFDIVPLNALNLGAVTSAFNSYSAYAQILQALETRRRIFSADPDWEIICGKIHVMGGSGLCSGSNVGQMLIIFKKENWEVDELRDRDEQIFYDYMKAVAKEVLGRIRSKYKSYPAAGGSIEMDGPELLAEAKEDYERLDNEIADSQGPIGPIIG